jgi:hypothetical protein
MVLLRPDDPATRAWWGLLEEMGCTYEGTRLDVSVEGWRTLYSVDVPATANHTKVFEVLAEGERSGVWRFQTGYDARTTPSSADPS